MFVSKIELINIRCFENESIELSPNINLFVGANNSGKSTILKSLFNLQGGGHNFVLQRNDIRVTENFLRVIIFFKDVNVEEKNLFRNRKSGKGRIIKDDGQVVIFSITNGMLKDDFKSEKLLFDSNDPNIAPDWLNRWKEFTRRDDSNVSHGYVFPEFPNMENENNFIYPFLSKRKTNYYSGTSKDAFTVYEDLRALPARIQKLSNSSHPKHKMFVEYCEDILGFQIGLVPGQNDNEPKLGAFVTQNSYVYLESMGEGVSNIVGLITFLLTEDRKLYLIEELENDIHPTALKKLLELVIEKSKTNQFVISTHSNIVLKYLASADKTKLFQVSWNPRGETKQGVLNISTSKIVQVENSPEERIKLLENLGYDIFDFDLYKSYLIFEESSAEKIVKDFLFPQFFPDLISKVRTIAAGGADDLPARYIDFHRLFVYVHNSPIYHGKVWALADGDTAGVNSIKKLQAAFKDWPEDNFINFSKNDFELFYPDRFKERVNEVLAIESKEKKREEKKKLLYDVLKWIDEDKELAKREFSQSCSEVIQILNTISNKVIVK